MFDKVVLRKDRVQMLSGADKGSYPLQGVEATVDTGEALSKRVTLTRLVATGAFALAWRKKQGGESFLAIEGPDFAWMVLVKRGQYAKAKTFAAKVNEAARLAA
ncbi:hypothetical protein BJH93_01660 [Kocuria polaris]|nr:hypothetical protein [Kocuria polaris]